MSYYWSCKSRRIVNNMKKVSFSQRTYYVGQTSASSCLIRASLHLSTQVRLCILTTYFILLHTYQLYALPTFLLRAAILKIISLKSSFLSPLCTIQHSYIIPKLLIYLYSAQDFIHCSNISFIHTMYRWKRSSSRKISMKEN